MAALSDATLLAISRISVGTPVTDDTDFTAMTPAEVAAKFALSSYGGDVGSYVYALGADGDYDALDPDDPPVTDLGLWAVGAFVNLAYNALLAGAVAGTPGTVPTGWNCVSKTSIDSVGTVIGLPAVAYTSSAGVTMATELGAVGPVDLACFSAVCAIPVGTLGPALIAYSNGGGGSGSTAVGTVPALHLSNYQPTNDGTIIISLRDDGPGQALLAGPQAVFGPVSPPVLALSSAATTTKLAAITQREVNVWKPFVVLIEATTGEDPGANQVFYSLSRSADELVEIYRATSTDQITLHIRSDGVDYTDALGAVADNTAFSVAINVFASFTAASLDGGTVQVLTAPKPSGVLTLESIGCKHDGTLQCNGPIAECTLIHPAVWTAAQLEAA